jgi:hypothetical protein
MEANADPQNWLGSDSLSADLIRMRSIAVKLQQFNLLTFE